MARARCWRRRCVGKALAWSALNIGIPTGWAPFPARSNGLRRRRKSLGDTIGTGTVPQTQQLIRTLALHMPVSQLAAHFHDTYGQALANIYAALELGIRTVDSSVAGLGGCPYAAGASGNVASEDVLRLVEGLGLHTGIDAQLLAEIGQWISDQLQRPNGSKSGRAMIATESRSHS